MLTHFKASGHRAVFLSESVANHSESVANHKGSSPLKLDRVSIRGKTDDALFAELEVLPLRATNNLSHKFNGN